VILVVLLDVRKLQDTDMPEYSRKIKITEEIAKSPNIAHMLSEEDLSCIADEVYTGFERDLQSRSKWERRMSAAMDLAIQMTKAKNFPWPNCSNVAFPLVTIATMQFHARAYPALISGDEVVRYKALGDDPQGLERDRAIRVAKHMSWQVLEQNEAWEEQHDRLLINLPIVGCAFKKTYYSPALGHNVSELVMAKDFVLDYYAKSVESCSRKTHVIPLYRNELWHRMATGLYCDCRDDAWFNQDATPYRSPNSTEEDRRTGLSQPTTDSATPFTILEQHTHLDLDGDGYAEPYIVVMEYSSREILRIAAGWDREEDVERDSKGRILRITPFQYFTKYTLIPAPDGSVYDLGLGILLGPLNESVNSLVNQLIDAGTMSNSAGGFIGKGAKIRSGTDSFSPLEWKRVDSAADDIRKNIFPLPVREPSAVLFNLLNLLINYTDRISGTTDIMVGENPGQNTPAETSRNMLAQGSKVFTGVMKRCWRSMRSEFRKLYILNAIHLPTSSPFGSEGLKILREDYRGDPTRLMPAADQNINTPEARVQQAITIKQAAASTPGYDPAAVERNFLRAMQVDGVDVFYPGVEKFPPGKSEKLAIEEMRLQAKQLELQQQHSQFILELQSQRSLIQAQIIQLQTQAMKNVADAKATGAQIDIAQTQQFIDTLKAHDESLRDRISLVMEGKKNAGTTADGGRSPGVAPPSGDEVPSSPIDSLGGNPQDVMG
jgi:chaperonin GroES